MRYPSFIVTPPFLQFLTLAASLFRISSMLNTWLIRPWGLDIVEHLQYLDSCLSPIAASSAFFRFMLCSTDVSLKRAVNSPKRHNPWCGYFLPEFKEISSQLLVLSNKRLPPLDYLSMSTFFFIPSTVVVAPWVPITIPYISLAKRLRQLVPLKRRTIQCNVFTESARFLSNRLVSGISQAFRALTTDQRQVS